MASVHSYPRFSWLAVWSVLLVFLSLNVPAAGEETRWVKYTGNKGTVWLEDNRKPALYTQNFGDCQGDSLINVTRFDAAYYKDNMTVLFHLEGNSALTNESLMRRKARSHSVLTFAYLKKQSTLVFSPTGSLVLI